MAQTTHNCTSVSILAVTLGIVAWLAAPASIAADKSRPEADRERPASAASASKSDESGDEAAFGETITVTATLSERPLDKVPASVVVISGEELNRRLAGAATDLARYVPGVYVTGDPTRLGPNSFTIRGIGGNRVETLVDGIPLPEEFLFGPLAIPQVGLDVSTLNRLEILKGAASAL